MIQQLAKMAQQGHENITTLLIKVLFSQCLWPHWGDPPDFLYRWHNRKCRETELSLKHSTNPTPVNLKYKLKSCGMSNLRLHSYQMRLRLCFVLVPAQPGLLCSWFVVVVRGYGTLKKNRACTTFFQCSVRHRLIPCGSQMNRLCDISIKFIKKIK